MAKRRTTKKKTYTRKMTLPLGVVLGFAPLVGMGISQVRAGGIGSLVNLTSAIVPYDFQNKRFSTQNLGYGLYPILAGLLAHKVAGVLGVNRALAAARIPFIRI